MAPQTIAAMSQVCAQPVVVEQLQAAACRYVSSICGTEAALVTCGAAAGLMLGASAILAGWDMGKIERLPETANMPNEFIIARAHRNGYDHAIRAAGARLVEVGMDEIRSGAGVRRTEAWEYSIAITPNTAGVVYVLTRDSRPALEDVVAVAHAHNLPVLVDAAAQLPPVSNLKSICASGADLVTFSGGKAIGGPQASGILCGRKDLVGSAFLQMMDLDEHPTHWDPPSEFIEPGRLVGPPRHGIGRMLKVGKEQVFGLLSALEQFTPSAVDERISTRMRWLARLRDLLNEQTIEVILESHPRPLLKVYVDSHRVGLSAMDLCQKLQQGSPPIYVNHAFLSDGWIAIEPTCLAESEVPLLASRIIAELSQK